MKHLHTFDQFIIVNESDIIDEGLKIVLGDGELTSLEPGDKLKFTEEAKQDKSGQMGRLDKKYLDSVLTFKSLAGGALMVKTYDDNTFIIDGSRFIKENQ